MAQANYTPISLYYSTTASAVPTAANLVPGELAINTNDGKLYYEDSSGVVRVLASKSTGTVGGSNTQVQFNSSGSLGGSSGLTWDGSFLTTSSIKNSALTSGRVTFAGASGLLSDSANLVFDGSNLSVNTTSAFASLTTSRSPGSAGQVNAQIAMTHASATTGYYISTIRGASTNEPEGLTFKENATERMRIDSDGNVTLQKNISVGAATPTTSGTGITFPATQSASSNANTLDDYEEGTWTPVLAGSTSTTGQSYAIQAGRYTKIGNICIAFFDAELANAGVLVGNAQINGLPFSSANTGDISQGSGSLSLFSSLATSLVSAIIGPQPNNNWINLRGLTAASGSTTNSFVATTFFNSSSRLSGTIIYQVA
jgi:hypothetical protein